MSWIPPDSPQLAQETSRSSFVSNISESWKIWGFWQLQMCILHVIIKETCPDFEMFPLLTFVGWENLDRRLSLTYWIRSLRYTQ